MDNESNESNFCEDIRGGRASFVIADTGWDVRAENNEDERMKVKNRAGGVCRCVWKAPNERQHEWNVWVRCSASHKQHECHK